MSSSRDSKKSDEPAIDAADSDATNCNAHSEATDNATNSDTAKNEEGEFPSLVVTNAIPLDDNCVAKAGEEIVRSWGRYDIFCGSAYLEPFEVWSYMVRRADPERPQSGTNIVQFERAEVKLMTPDDAVIVPTFNVAVGGSLVPGDGTDPGKGVVFVELIPEAAVGNLPNPDEFPQIVAQVQLFGMTNGDVEVETGIFRFPIDLCNGCFTYFIDQCVWTEADVKMLADGGLSARRWV